MQETLTVYIVGDFKSEAADGLAEFNYQNVNLLSDTFKFEFVEFDNTHEAGYYFEEFRDGIRVHRFGINRLLPLKLPTAFLNWQSQLPARQAVFHLSHIWNINNYLISRRLVKSNIPYIITPHDSYVYERPYNESRPFLNRMYRQAFVQIFDKYVLKHAATVHALTSHCLATLKRLTSSKIAVVTNQVKDVNIPFSMADIKAQVCFIGRISIYQKGIDLALEAFSKLKQQNNRGTVRFILIGPVVSRSTMDCNSLVKSLGLNPGIDVIFTGKVSESQRNDILASSKVYLQLSRYEGFGLSIAQALSAFKPVIVSANVPIGSVILRYGAGFVVNNEREAAEALNAIFSMSEEVYIEMASNARICYEKEFHPDVIKPQLIGLYKSVIPI